MERNISLADYRSNVKSYTKSKVFRAVGQARSVQDDADKAEALEFLDQLIDSIDELSSLAKVQFKKDMRWLVRWGPLFEKFGQFYQIASEFGMQMVVSLFLALVLIGVFAQPTWILFASTFSLLLIASFLRYQFSKAVVRRVFLLMEQEDVPREIVANVRIEFLKAIFLQTLSLLVAVAFSLKIVAGAYPWNSMFEGGSLTPFVTNVAANAIANVVVFLGGATASFFAKLGINSIAPATG